MSNDSQRLEPRLVAIDRYYLSHINDMAQGISSDTESLIMALSTIITDDDASNGIITEVQGYLFHSSQLASDISEMLDRLILLPPVEVTDRD